MILMLEVRNMNKQIRHLKRQVSKLKAEKKDLEMEIYSLKNRKQKIFSIISHDLMGQIGIYNNIVDYLLQKIHSENVEITYIDKTLTQLRESSKSTYSLLENLLYWAKSQSNIVEYFPMRFNLADMINSQIEIVKLSAENKNINIETYFSHDIYMNTDENMLKTVIRNLLSNAIKFTEKNGKIVVSFSQKDNESVSIEIKDSGIGISEEKIQRIMVGKSIKSSTGTSGENGSGLGLILCKDFITKLDGSFTISSIQNIGSSFKITLPVNKD